MVPLIGRRYTWSNERESPTLVKLDRVLCTNDWEDIYPECLLQSHATQLSDHCPLIIGLKDGSKTKKRFHFESFWTKLDGFQDVVTESWSKPLTTTCAVERVSLKLKRLNRDLQSWSQKQVGHVKTQLALARDILHRIEIAQDSRVLSQEEGWLRGELKWHCLVLSSLERTIARLRSGIRYLKDGDTNTSFFHSQARCRRRKNTITKLQVGDQIVTSHEEKQEAMFHYYEQLLGTSHNRSHTLDLQAFHRPGLDLTDLDAPITKDEVWNTIKTLPADRAPGPDGYTGRFYRACWQIIKSDIMAAILIIQQGNARKLELLNSAYLTLVPKRADAILPSDFRPISLMHSFAKLITKVLANRLSSRLNEMITVNQSAFIKGRCIQIILCLCSKQFDYFIGKGYQVSF